MNTNHKTIRAAIEFLRSGPSLSKVNGMSREDVAAVLEQSLPGPRGHYRDMLDASDLRES